MNAMKKNIFSISSLLSFVAFAALLTGCADYFDTSSPAGEKPAAVTEAEMLAQYETLVSYIDAEKFSLANTLASADLDGKTAAASLTLSNFNEVTIPDLFVHNKQVDNDGKIDVLFASSLAADVSERGINIFSSPLCPSTNVNTTYLTKLIEPQTVEEPETTGYDVISFEEDEPGKTYPLIKATGEDGKGTAVVENDPKGESGHVVHVTKTNNSYPAITFKFPEGRKLGDYSEFTLDFMAKNSTALNQKLFVAVGGKNAEFKSAKEFGCAQNQWGRGVIVIDFAALAFSDEQKQQKEVTVVIGPKLLNCDYLIDNISFKYKYKPTYEVEKTEEEKFLIIGEALDEYITAAMEAAPTINSWAVADCPVTSAPDLIWKQTLHDTYFGYAAHLMREQRSDAKLFVSEYLMDPEVRATFLHLLTANAIGMDQINGIDVLLPIDVASFDVNGFVTMLGELKATGKLIRLTIQNVTGSDALAADALAQVIATYKKQIPAAQQYGINFQAVTESASNVGLWTTGFNRKSSYASVAEALK
jgi:hypothetical protein